MSSKTKYQKPSGAGVGAAGSRESKPTRGADDEWKAGEDTEITAPPEERSTVKELWALLTEVRTAAFFVGPEEKRLPVVHRIGQLHGALLRSKAIKGYVGGTESRQAKRLLDSYGLKFKPSAAAVA